MHKRTKQHAGFTLVELLTAVSLLGLMLFLINQLFQSTSIAVSTSVQQSKAIAATRVIGEQINEDFDAIVGPGATGNVGGYIVIFNTRLPNNTAMINPRNLTEVEIDGLRSDQIVFIRDANQLRSMTPRDQASYGSDLTATSGEYAKVWYGHIERTNPNGSPRPNNATNRLGGADSGFDRIASDFILGRQTMLFNPNGLNTATDTHADTAYWNSPVRGTAYPGTDIAYLGLTDVTAQQYEPGGSPPTTPLMNELGPTLPATNRGTQNNNYLGTAFPSQRLKANANPTGTDYESWAIAQTHPILSPGCSEFIVQFAADLDGNGRLDTTGSRDRGGRIIWYDGFNLPAAGWDAPTDPAFQPLVANSPTAKALVFRLDDVEPHGSKVGTPGVSPGDIDNNSCWPYLIRIRYRLHDTRGRLMGNYATALVDNIDNDGDGTADEPDEDQIAGQWYEHIIRVDRP